MPQSAAEPTKIVIWGAGAVGLGLACTLGAPIGVLGRDATTLRAIETHGLRRSGLFGPRSVPPDALTILSAPDDLVERRPDWILLCTKAFASGDVARQLAPLAPLLTRHSNLLLCQNGWGNEAPFLPFWPKHRLFHARIITGFHRRRANEVEVTAHAAPIALGTLFAAEVGSGKSRALLAPIASRLTRGGIPAETSDDMQAVLWAKMLYNCALNPLGALAGLPYGALTRDPRTRAIVEAVIREIFRVLAATGIEVAWNDADAYLDTFHRTLIPPTAAHESSMLQDLRAGRQTEIEALCGAVERLASTVGVETPVVSALATLVRGAES